VGASALVDRYWLGLGPSTHLTDQFPWGLWKFNVLWGIALGAGGFLTAGIVYVFKLKKFEPVLRPAVLVAFLAYQCLGVGSLLVDLGRPYKIWHTLIYWQHHSLLFEISWCIMIYTCVLAIEFLPVVLEKFGKHKLGHAVHRIAVPFVIVGVVASTLHQSSLGGLFLIVPQKIMKFCIRRSCPSSSS
jgi:Ni/Fe-hydrogenase subunit HybB-like protein